MRFDSIGSNKSASKVHCKALDNIASINDDKLLEFASTLLNKSHAVYKQAKFAVNPYDPEVDILLPALELPVFPDAYKEEIKNFVAAKSDNIRNKKFLRQMYSTSYNKTIDGRINIDGVPYNPKDFQFPTSPQEKQNLSELAELLGAVPALKLSRMHSQNVLPTFSIVQKPSIKMKPRLKTHLRPQPGKYMNERMTFIRNNGKYQAELKESINSKLTKTETSEMSTTHSGGRFVIRRGRKLMISDDKEISNLSNKHW